MVEIFNPTNNILEVTESAAKHFKKHLEKHPQSIGVYIGTKVMGCSGLSYDIDFVESKPLETTEVVQHGLKFFVSDKSKDFLNGLKIDYVKHEFGLYKLEYTNPNESARCGCGESFTV
ncbi:HesB/IscA family protein [Allofrancisella frigidaquae]|uniref:Iron-sulfur cluster assembly accessory protein n=1 Tax=Allofrancisella frigidaquae TaxID=1085644 RepID=A0A6M3HSY5_9GAMM|nr:iron-sulfur cluster assembly accessory protein [Allofrancisella frigidaquae]KEI36060.1 iron binding protein SufA for iron-sulfur cluster assembly [Francisella sp. W12-1067]QIV94298.1 iron-sulfur cluster assembly accessory protein [Allofrancisella frigidaquae]